MKHKHIPFAACLVLAGFFAACKNHNPSGEYHSDSTKFKAPVVSPGGLGRKASDSSGAQSGGAPATGDSTSKKKADSVKQK